MFSLINKIKETPGIRYLREKRYTRFFNNADNLNLFNGVFNDFVGASLSAPTNKNIGYDNEEPASLYDEYMKEVSSVDFPALFWLEKLQDEVRSIYDFGGHVGIKYYAYRELLSSKERIRWTTYDLPAVVSRGRQISRRENATSLNFSDNVYDLENGYDLLFASGSLQYLENPIELIFGNLKNKPKYVLINMTPFHESKAYVTLQNIGPAFCPYKIFHRDSFLSQLKSFGYELQAEWKNPEKVCIIPFHAGHSIVGYTGLLLKLV